MTDGRILIIDNFDSFTQNIAQYIFEVTGTPPLVVSNTTRYDELALSWCDAVIISPGPGHPSRPGDFGVCAEVLARSEKPILGICLGHQGIIAHYGGQVVHAPAPMHGIVDVISHSGRGLFDGLPADLSVVRYHSLAGVDLPPELEVHAMADDGVVMAVAHRTRPLWGVQFHPESIDTESGRHLLRNFVELAIDWRSHDLSGTAPAPPARLAAPAEIPPVVRACVDLGVSPHLLLQHRSVELDSALALFERRYGGDSQAFWLDSEGSLARGGRYSVMGGFGGSSIALSYRLEDHTLTLRSSHGGERQVVGDLFDLLEQITEGIDISLPEGWSIPFSGGLVGYLGYELKALTLGAVGHRSATDDAWFLLPTDFTVVDHALGRAVECRLVPDHDELSAWAETALPRAAPVVNGAGAGHDVTSSPSADYRPGPVPAGLLGLRDDEATYLAKIADAQRYILDGESYEICLTNLADVPVDGPALEMYARMRSVSPVPYGAFLRTGEVEVLSSSPEMFLRVDSTRVIESSPIKGTRPRGACEQQDAALAHDLATSVKDRAENLMIVDLVRHDLNSVCSPGTVHVPSAFEIRSYPSVHQLVSTVRGQLAPHRSCLAALRACFPGGSMTGAPKKRTLEIIDELEGAPRGIYSGALGWISFHDTLDLSIVIRTAVVADGRARFGIGGAITARSVPDEEFDEILVKASVPAFGACTSAALTHA